MSQLFTPTQAGPLRLANRIVIAPMCEYSADAGCATDWHDPPGPSCLVRRRAAVRRSDGGGADGRITPGDLGLWSDETEAALGRVVTAMRRYSPIKLGIQLGHAGRKASSHAPGTAGSWCRPLKAAGGAGRPRRCRTMNPSRRRGLDSAGLARVRDAFVASARRALRLGFDAIELHAAHGYLMHQFLSPLANRRDDAYGGSLENRMRFPLEVFRRCATWCRHPSRWACACPPRTGWRAAGIWRRPRPSPRR